MTKPGRKPKPTALKLLHGDRKDRINTDEPIPPEGEHEPLRELADDAQRVWDHLVPILEGMRVMTTADVLAAGILSEQVAMYWRAQQLVERHDILVHNNRGQVVRNPAVQAQRDAAHLVLRFCQEFGLTPASRASLITSDGGRGTGDPRERFFA